MTTVELNTRVGEDTNLPNLSISQPYDNSFQEDPSILAIIDYFTKRKDEDGPEYRGASIKDGINLNKNIRLFEVWKK